MAQQCDLLQASKQELDSKVNLLSDMLSRVEAGQSWIPDRWAMPLETHFQGGRTCWFISDVLRIILFKAMATVMSIFCL